MRAWNTDPLPRPLPGGRIPLVHDTVSNSLRTSAHGPVAGLYVCGITPYDATHLGHASTYLAFDLLVRAWRDAGLEVHYAQNVTDVDDPLLERAAQTGTDWRELAASQIELYRNDMQALALLAPTAYRGVVEEVPAVVSAVEELVRAGTAYGIAASDGAEDYYADLAADPDFGSFAHLDAEVMESLFAERGGDPGRPGKRGRLDPLLWRAKRPGEPQWPGGSLGPGRPGWHIECAVIARDYLGSHFSVLGGGQDLVFPHHEMSVSHARALGAPVPRLAMHTGLLSYQGEKMSKSRGNLVFVSELLAHGWRGAEIRLALLDHHYRDSVEWTGAELEAARKRLATWSKACAQQAGPSAVDAVEALRDALCRDLDSPAALAAMDEWAARALSGESVDPQAGGVMADACEALLGVRP